MSLDSTSLLFMFILGIFIVITAIAIVSAILGALNRKFEELDNKCARCGKCRLLPEKEESNE